MNPRVSLIMSVYNGAAHLRESIESILHQSYTQFELVIINDASTDNTAALLAAYAQQDQRVVVLHNESNLGLTKSLNKAIRASSGEYVARMDAGDISERDRFERQVSFLDSHPEHCLVGSWAWIIDDAGTKIGSMTHGTEHEPLRKELIKHNPFIHSSLMIRRRALDAIGLYDEQWRYSQDHDLLFRLLPQGKIANIGAYLVSYRMYRNSITSTKNKEQTKCAIKARIRAIQSGQYPIWSYVFLVSPLLGYLMPYRFKLFIKKFL